MHRKSRHLEKSKSTAEAQPRSTSYQRTAALPEISHFCAKIL